MSAVEELQAAIDKLAALRAGSAVGPWHAFGSGPANGDHWYVFDHDEEMVVQVSSQDGSNEDERQPNADLIVTLHRTIDAQLAILTAALEFWRAYEMGLSPSRSHDSPSLLIAAAINGTS